ncbi:MAG: BlaI/MecI/CopY family transcriptional regulator [Candidatus Hydrogenedentes bacterium]|nr:BlaI/MecI/CopY family transcriptional regulator [Candidatus Hydrogenedentota bacterium]
MGRRQLIRPTDAELEILHVLWERGAGTVRDVHEALNQTRDKQVGPTTILKLMQIMAAKGLLTRDEGRRPQIFIPTQSEEETQRHLMGDLLDRAFRGSAHKLVLQALTARKASKTELQAIRDLIDKYGGERS